jgi:hypothetical protein
MAKDTEIVARAKAGVNPADYRKSMDTAIKHEASETVQEEISENPKNKVNK